MSVISLNAEKLKEYEQLINLEKDEALKLITQFDDVQRKGSKEGSGDLSSYAFHQADQGTDTQEHEKSVYLLETEKEKVKQLNQALKRIYEKTYGICEICGSYIPDARLKIIPYARYCIECKTKEEKKKHR